MGININELLERVELVNLVEEKLGVKLEHSGHGWHGICPFHGGTSKTAFVVYEQDDPQRWYCHRCGIGGDAIALVEKWQTFDDLKDTLEYLADYVGMKPEERGWGQNGAAEYKEQRARRDVLTLAARYYAEQLWSEKGKEALAYVRGRGFTDEALRLAGWGYSDGGKGLYQYLQEKNADLTLVHTMGLVRADTTDFTANAEGREAAPAGYLIYPHSRTTANRKKCPECKDAVTWHEGDACLRHTQTLRQFAGVNYLSARAVERFDGEGKIIPRPSPKDKSRNIVGARQVYWALVPGDRGLVIVEGQADAESLRQLGFSALALCGLGGLPDADLMRVKKREAVCLALDSEGNVDEMLDAKDGKLVKTAGQIGPLTLCLPHLPNGHKDFNDWLKGGACPEDVKAHLKGGETWLEKRLQHAKTCPPNEVEERMIELGGLLAALPQGARPRYYRLAMNKLDLTRRELLELVKLAQRDDHENGNGLSLSSVRDGQICFLGEPLGNFAAWIGNELTRENGMDTPVVEYTLNGQLADGTPLQTITLPAETFASLDWVARYWGARPVVYIPRGKAYLIARAMQEISLPTLLQERVFTYTGWREIDGQRGYLSGSGFLTADGLNERIRVDLGGTELRHYALPAPPTDKKELHEAIRASLEFLGLAPLTVTAPVWAAMFASVFTEIRALYTVLWVYGTTQSGKSTLSHLALTHFGTGFINGRQYLPPDNWESSLTALEGSMFTVKDAPLIIDDYAPQFASAFDAREMQRTAQKVIRRAGNRTARNRSRADLTQQTYRPPRGLVMVTAELPLSGESTAGRMLYIPVAPGDLLPAKDDKTPRPKLDHAQKQAEAGLYGQAMAAFLQWMAANWERAIAKFLDTIEQSNIEARSQDVQNRLPDYYAILDAAQQVALTAFYELGVLSANEAADIAYQNGKAIMDVVVNQAERIAAESPVRKFFEALDSMLERQKVYLSPKTKAVSYIPPLNADLIGYFDPADETVIYLNDDACLEHVRDYWAKLGENFDTTKDALRRQVSQIPGLIAKRGIREILFKTWIAAKNCNSWTLAISRTRLESLYQVEMKNRETSVESKEPLREVENDD